MAAKKAAKPKRKKADNQVERFKKAARDLTNAGELNLADADEKFKQAIGKIAPPKMGRKPR